MWVLSGIDKSSAWSTYLQSYDGEQHLTKCHIDKSSELLCDPFSGGVEVCVDSQRHKQKFSMVYSYSYDGKQYLMSVISTYHKLLFDPDGGGVGA